MPKQPLWTPSKERAEGTNMYAFMQRINEKYGKNFTEYEELYDWSVANIPEFWTEMWDVAGLTAPRHMLAVNGRDDRLFGLADVQRAAMGTKAIFAAAGCLDHFQHRFGDSGHRFYADLMWPFVMKAMGNDNRFVRE